MKIKKANKLQFTALLICVSCAFHSLQLTGQSKENLFITGSTPLPAGEKARLIVTDDYITNKVITLCETTISNEHTFQLATTINQIHLAQLAIRTSRAEFFIAPDWNYPLEIEMDSMLFEVFDPSRFGGFLQIRNLKPDTNDLNFKINYFLAFYESLLQNFDVKIFYFKDKSAYDTVMNELSKRFPVEYEPDNYYKSYIYYTIAQLDKVIYAKYPDLLYQKYFDNEYILYNNPAYMQFFKDCYSNYLYTSPHISKSMLNEYINNAPNYPALFNEVGNDRHLVNERLRELVLLFNLWQYIDHEEFSRKNIIKLIEHIAKNTHFPEHKKIVDNIFELIGNNQYGKILPKFAFKSENNKNVKINQFNGKWTYLHFYSNHCEECIREMLIIKELQEKFKDDITFVSVSLDLDYNQFKSFREEYKLFDWEFVHFNDQYDWLIAMGIHTLPENILLNPDGEIALRNAPDPNRELAAFLERLLYKEKDVRINPMFHHPNK